MTTELTSRPRDKRPRRLTPDAALLSAELLEAIATYLPPEGMASFLDALPEQLRTPALQLVATLSQVLGLQVLWPTLDLSVLVQLADADNILAQLLSVNPRLCVTSPTSQSIAPEVVTPPRTWPTLRHLSLTIATWTMDSAVLASLQQVFVANAACLRSIDVRLTALPIPTSNGLHATQSTCLAALADLLVSIECVTKLVLRATDKVRFPETAAAMLAAWIDAMPLTSLTMRNVDKPSAARRLWANPSPVSIALGDTRPPAHGVGGMWLRHLTHLELPFLLPSEMSLMVQALVQSPLVSLHMRGWDATRYTAGHPGAPHFLEYDLPRLNQLTTLRLTNVRLTTTHCLTLALLLPRYTHLGLTSNRMGDAGILALAPFLRHTSQLETLTLVDQGFGDVGASALATALMHTPRLRTLDLGRNNIKISGVMALSGLLPHLPRLATWRLCNNPLGAKGLVFLLRAWTYVELDTTTLIDARDTVGSEDDARDCDALISALPRHRRCLAGNISRDAEIARTEARSAQFKAYNQAYFAQRLARKHAVRGCCRRDLSSCSYVLLHAASRWE
ncbi:hypothetical protein SPRG_21440 [Saprolegnia parasitica CBS 223.65]|uniref:RNI-like protein n=1 Tax=Saprolegnia parasitica (strain CBS 223.65) TaxID=695850 RepID=A0A067C0Q6_SAPPC|nr:hypothetical protein SPRG_21440 [Saprolegnia parasitica CBS 223.65]KDO20136.1 hypothetical protein SPRG_21440 [Saprolegnia parasitica CBS 223.65]|eukprot:XP_012209183.1 hypothetical protein SPRG_21440 [Saprolegnia parasitica CBS 223.65]